MLKLVIKLHLWLLPQNWVLVSLVRYHQLPLISLNHLGAVSFALSLLWVTDLLTELVLRWLEAGTPWACISGHFTLSVDMFSFINCTKPQLPVLCY